MLLRKAAQVFPLPLWTHLCSCALVASILKQVSHHIQVVLLSCHVQGSKSILQNTVTVSSFISASNWLVTIFTSEQFQNRCMFFFHSWNKCCWQEPVGGGQTHLRLSVDVCASFDQSLNNLSLTSQGGDVKSCVSFLHRKNGLSEIMSIKQKKAVWCFLQNKIISSYIELISLFQQVQLSLFVFFSVLKHCDGILRHLILNCIELY